MVPHCRVIYASRSTTFAIFPPDVEDLQKGNLVKVSKHQVNLFYAPLLPTQLCVTRAQSAKPCSWPGLLTEVVYKL